MGYSPWRCKDSDTTEQLSTAHSIVGVHNGEKMYVCGLLVVRGKGEYGRTLYFPLNFSVNLRICSVMSDSL